MDRPRTPETAEPSTPESASQSGAGRMADRPGEAHDNGEAPVDDPECGTDIGPFGVTADAVTAGTAALRQALNVSPAKNGIGNRVYMVGGGLRDAALAELAALEARPSEAERWRSDYTLLQGTNARMAARLSDYEQALRRIEKLALDEADAEVAVIAILIAARAALSGSAGNEAGAA